MYNFRKNMQYINKIIEQFCYDVESEVMMEGLEKQISVIQLDVSHLSDCVVKTLPNMLDGFPVHIHTRWNINARYVLILLDFCYFLSCIVWLWANWL